MRAGQGAGRSLGAVLVVWRSTSSLALAEILSIWVMMRAHRERHRRRRRTQHPPRLAAHPAPHPRRGRDRRVSSSEARSLGETSTNDGRPLRVTRIRSCSCSIRSASSERCDFASEKAITSVIGQHSDLFGSYAQPALAAETDNVT